MAADRAVRVERFKLTIVLEAILELQDLYREAQQLIAMREGGGLDVPGPAGDLLPVGVALRQLKVDEGVIVHADEASSLSLQALDFALGLADLAGVILAERL